MAIPPLVGHFLDRRFGTKVAFTAFGAVFGLVYGIWHLLKLADPQRRRGNESRARRCAKWSSSRFRSVIAQFNSSKGRGAILGIALLLAGAIVIPVAYWWADVAGAWAAAAAWATCFISGLLAYWLAQRFNDPQKVLYQVLSGTLVRMSIPLAACLGVHLYGGTLAEAGFVYYILAFYFVTLAVDTALVARSLPQESTESQTG